jgi:hypothetical protein
LKLKYNESPSNVAEGFNVHRYTKVERLLQELGGGAEAGGADSVVDRALEVEQGDDGDLDEDGENFITVGRCRLTPG